MSSDSTALFEYTVERDGEHPDDPEKTVVLVHGFPDSPAMWRETSAHLTGRGYRVVRLALPGFEEGAKSGPQETFEETVDRMHATLVHAGAAGATLVGHDWGAVFLYLLLRRHPEAAGRLVTIEIGASSRAPFVTLCVLLYQAALNLAYALGPGLGDRLMSALCRLAPRRPEYPGRPEPKSHHGWLYRQAWREAGSEGPWPYYFRNAVAKWTPPPTLPFLFLYGERGLGPIQFHTAEWREAMTSRCPQSRAQALPGGHWCMLESADEFHLALDEFMASATQPDS